MIYKHNPKAVKLKSRYPATPTYRLFRDNLIRQGLNGALIKLAQVKGNNAKQ